MKLTLWMVLACLVASSPPAHGQSAVRWWDLDNGFGSSWGNSYGLLSSVGQTFVGVSVSATVRLGSGFLADTRLRTVPLTAVEASEQVPLSYSLGQNYPNPFNPSTTIEFSILQEGHVSLVVYDMLGRAVEKLIDGQYAPGLYQVKWNARAFSSGMYIYRIEAGDFVATRKLIILR